MRLSRYGIPLMEGGGQDSIYTLILFDGCDIPEILHCSHFATDETDKIDEIIEACDEYFAENPEEKEFVFDEPAVLGKEDQPILKMTSGEPYPDLFARLSEIAKYKYPEFIPHVSVTSNVDEFKGKSASLVVSKNGEEVKRYPFSEKSNQVESSDDESYPAWLEARNKIEDAVKEAQVELKKITGENKGGLTPDSIRSTEEYKNAKGNFDKAFKTLRDFNGKSPKEFMRRASKRHSVGEADLFDIWLDDGHESNQLEGFSRFGIPLLEGV